MARAFGANAGAAAAALAAMVPPGERSEVRGQRQTGGIARSAPFGRRGVYLTCAYFPHAREAGADTPSSVSRPTRDQSDPLAPPGRRLADVANSKIWVGGWWRPPRRRIRSCGRRRRARLISETKKFVTESGVIAKHAALKLRQFRGRPPHARAGNKRRARSADRPATASRRASMAATSSRTCPPQRSRCFIRTMISARTT
jgi:hypothetical protein